MSPESLFRIQLILGYLAWILLFGTYLVPKFRHLERPDALRAIATLHSFRFFGLVFLLPGVVGQELPQSFASFAAYWDFATGVLALLALLAFRVRPVFLSLAIAFNVVGTIDLLFDYWHAIQTGVPEMAGQLGAAYAIPVLYVPALMITHVLSFYLLLNPRRKLLAAAA